MDNSDSVLDEIIQNITEANKLSSQDQHDKAIGLYTHSLTMHPKRALIYCARGKLYNDIKEHHASKADYEVALAIVENKEAEDIRNEKVVEAAEAIQQIIELQELSIMRSEVLTRLDTIELDQQTKIDIQELDTTQEKFASKILDLSSIHLSFLKREKSKSLLTPIARTDFVAYKEQSKELLDQMMERIKRLEEATQQKLNNYNEMLDQVLIRNKMSESEQEKIKNYYDAFLSTFSSVFIASQAIDNGTISFKTEVEKMDILTLAISFIPVVGEGISTALEFIADFVNNAIVIKRARIMASIAPDTVSLNQIIAGAAYSILIDEGKQKQILNPVKEEAEKTHNIFQEIAHFIKEKSKEIDSKLYGDKYDTFEKRLGNLDAQFVITKYLSVEIRKPSLQEKFASEVLKSHDIKHLNIRQEEKGKNKKGRKEIYKDKSESKKKKSKCACF